jgi:hypothetical protein
VPPLELHPLPLAAAACALFALLFIAWSDARNLLRPSVAVAAMQLGFVVPGAVLADVSIDPDIRLAVAVVPLAMLLLVWATPRLGRDVRSLVSRCRHATAMRPESGVAILLSAGAASLVGVVFALLPWTRIGLYMLIVAPDESLEARAASLRELDVPKLKSLITTYCRILVPIGLGLIACLPLSGIRRLAILPLAVGPAALLAIGGARLQLVLGAMTLAVALAIRRWSTVMLGLLVLLAAAALVVIGAATAARIGEERGIGDVWERVFLRATVLPFVAGAHHLEFVERFGRWSPEVYGFPFKTSLGFTHVEPAQAVGDWVNPGAGSLVSPPAAMDLIASFGLPFGMCVMLAYGLLLDFVARTLAGVPPATAVACLTSLLLVSLALVNTTAGSTATGVVMILVVARFVGWRYSRRRAEVPRAGSPTGIAA